MAYSLQETFDQVAEHLLTQGRQATFFDQYGEEVCRYRTDQELKCAVGCLIPDEDYDPSFEDEKASRVWDLCPSLQKHDLRLLERLQVIHDSASPDDWPAKLRMVAEDLRLRTSVLDQQP